MRVEKRIGGGAGDPAFELVTENGRRVPWTGLQTGPLTLSPSQVEAICQELLGHGTAEVAARAEVTLRPVRAEEASLPSLFLHSTTPELKTFDGDADALIRGTQGGDFTTYKEARSVYLARPGDLVIGRTQSWRAAVAASEAIPIVLEDEEHYYLSHALLDLARRQHRGGETGSALGQLITLLRRGPRVGRLYAFELEMQIFLLWLAREAGLATLPLEANRPAVAAAWNRKDVLHPTVARAQALPDPKAEEKGLDYLLRESRESALVRRLDIAFPSLPGYTLERAGRPIDDFVAQLLTAAAMLRRRHGLTTGCLKASESGDGARIQPGIDLRQEETLESLGREAWRHGDDYLLEAHVTYGQVELAGQSLPTALSAHIRSGAVAPKATAQFMRGTSWKGNLLLDEGCLDLFSITPDQYRRLQRFVSDFHGAFTGENSGLVLAGIDFAIGTVGGHYGAEPLLGVQDLNVSFTGAECLRAFLDKAQAAGAPETYGVTRIYVPTDRGRHAALARITGQFRQGNVFADTVASIPGRWAMVGITGTDPRQAAVNLSHLQQALLDAGLIEAP